jgi:putative oxidoreductase
MEKWLNLAGRILLAVMFIISGYGKIAGYAGTSAYMASKGVPGALLPLVILLELGGGIAIVLGFQTRIVAFLLAGFCIVSGVIFHFEPGNQGQMINFMKNIAIAGGFLVLMQAGAPWLSIDAMLARKRKA